MRVAIIGQQAFGKAVLEAFLARGDTVAAVFCAPDAGRPDPLRLAAEAAGITTHQFPKLTAPEALAALRDARADIGIMAFVTQFVSQEFCAIPGHGTIQFHPSLLPLHRGASALSWAIILGRTETGFSIFRPSDGWDEGDVLLARTVPIGPDDTLGTLYFGKVFPAGVTGLLDAADLVLAGHATAAPQDHAAATYEGILGDAESRIDWHAHVDHTYNRIRACDPSPGAWTHYQGQRLALFECRKHPARTYAEVRGKRPGEIVATGPEGLTIHAPGGFVTAQRAKAGAGKKLPAADLGLAPGSVLT